jgi:predicted RNase H-related nuclease YkuK (DUF458 family)
MKSKNTFVDMCGFAPKVKPEAFAASYAADRLKEILSA